MPSATEPSSIWLAKLLAFFLGLAFGSFANVLIFRIPRGLSIIAPRSFCPQCQQKIAWYDNIPVISFVLLMGRCRKCGAPISLRYPLVELCSAVLSVASLYKAWVWAGPSPAFFGIMALWVFVFAFCFLLVVATFIDLEHWRIPLSITVPGMLLGLAKAFSAAELAGVSWLSSLLGLVVASLPLTVLIEVYRRLTGREGMGYGDVFLLGMVGAYLGIQALPFVFFASSAQGLIVALPIALMRRAPNPPWEAEKERKIRHTAIPFGPFIALAAFEWLFFEDLIRPFLPLPG